MNNKKQLTEKTIESTNIFTGNFLNVFCDKVELPDKSHALREYVIHSGAACIIAINDMNEIVLEYQYRYPVKQVMLELPAGKLENNENPLECAKRELFEETGYTATTWVELGTCLPCIGYSNEKIIYFLATNLIKGTPQLDEGEFIETITMPLNQFIAMITKGKIKDSKTLSGIMLYLGYTNKINNLDN